MQIPQPTSSHPPISCHTHPTLMLHSLRRTSHKPIQSKETPSQHNQVKSSPPRSQYSESSLVLHTKQKNVRISTTSSYHIMNRYRPNDDDDATMTLSKGSDYSTGNDETRCVIRQDRTGQDRIGQGKRVTYTTATTAATSTIAVARSTV